MSKEKTYIAIDLKSFFASVECRERGLDPLNTNLVVADSARTDKTICLAVTPSLKAYGISGRARLFEVVQRVNNVNRERKNKAPNKMFTDKSYINSEIESNPSMELSYIVAPPRMSCYVEYSTKIYDIYLKYIAPEDIYVYSIDEVFIDATEYLKTYKMTARQLAEKMINNVLEVTGITATAGISSNLFLCKVALDIVAKHIEPDKNGVRIAELTEQEYRKNLWNHRPITDFWRVGKGYAKRLEQVGLFTMGDIAKCSVGDSGDYYNEELLYKLFGVNAELLIDHAWGYEPCTISDIKAYKPLSNSLCSGQVLLSPYPFDKGRIVTEEMIEALVLDLVSKGLVTDQIVLTVGYDRENLTNLTISSYYKGEIIKDAYGRSVPKYAHGTTNLDFPTSSSHLITTATLKLYDKIVNKGLLIRKITLTANRVISEERAVNEEKSEQLNLFVDYEERKRNEEKLSEALRKEKKIQKTLISIKNKYGKNAIIKGVSLQDGATGQERNKQIGGHKA